MTSALFGMAGLLSLALAADLHRVEWRASTFSRSTQGEAALAIDGRGNIFAVWSSRRQRDGRYGVYGQRFDAEGVAVGGETCLSLWPLSHQRRPAVAFDSTGSAWTVWQSHGQDGSGGAIIARRFDAHADGAGGSEVLVNQVVHGHQGDPVVAVSMDGRALVVWTTVSSGGATAVRARWLSGDGAVFGDEIRVSVPADRWASNAGVAGAPGDLAVVYAVADESRRPQRISVRVWDAGEQRFGESIDVSGPLTATPIEPVIAAGPSGYVVAWLEQSGPDGDYAVRARRLDSRGCPIGEPFEAGPPGGRHSGAAVAVADDGRFAVAVTAPDGDGSGVFVRFHAADGAALGPCLRMTGHTGGRQAMRPAAGTRRLAFAGDRLVCAWSGDGGFGDSSSVNLTMLAPAALAEVRRGVTPDMKPAGPGGAAGDPRGGTHAARAADLRCARHRRRDAARGVTGPGENRVHGDPQHRLGPARPAPGGRARSSRTHDQRRDRLLHEVRNADVPGPDRGRQRLLGKPRRDGLRLRPGGALRRVERAVLRHGDGGHSRQ
ncbi:MAG: hypothetical protein IID28_10425 [Planctomycetes bacterium]|nr:hypothetical protein [Planctomycetota bacterium]